MEDVKQKTDNWRTSVKDACYVSLGVVLLLALIQPFDIDKLENGRMLFIVSEGMCVFVCSIIVYCLQSAFPLTRKLRNAQTSKCFILNLLVHYAIFTPLLSAVLCTFNMWYHNLPLTYAWFDEQGNFTLHYFFLMCFWVSAIGVFIMIWQYYRFRTFRLQQELVDIRAINALLEARQQQIADSASESIAEEQRNRITIQGNAQNAHLEVCPNDIIYIESMSNYADIAYIKAGHTQHATLRITLKQLREQLQQAECLVQCHRAFLVNLNFVRALSVRSAGTYEVELFGSDKRIPVSRANADAMKQHLEK